MEYKRFTVKTFEREPEKWQASVRRTNGRPLWAGRAKIRHFVTGIDATTPQRAVQMALAAIDRGAFSRQPVGVAPAGVRGRGTPGPQARHVNGQASRLRRHTTASILSAPAPGSFATLADGPRHDAPLPIRRLQILS